MTLVLALLSGTVHAAGKGSPRINTDPMTLVGRTIKNFYVLSAQEAQMLEPVCVLVLGSGGPGLMWYDAVKGHPILNHPSYNMAQGAISLHHYCYGEVAKNRRFFETDPKKRAFHVERMLDEYGFVINSTQYRNKHWPYLKKVLVEYGKAALLAKKLPDGITAFNQALKLDPAYEPAHIALAEAMLSMGNKDDALAQVTEGLKRIPESEKLQKRFLDYGGKLPYPEPYPKPAALAETQPTPTETPAPTESAPSETAPTPPVLNEDEFKIGTVGEDPKRPNCRFCP
ncbi:MAG: tetratricopeptide repeat protein [Pseudomonadota bacterium]